MYAELYQIKQQTNVLTLIIKINILKVIKKAAPEPMLPFV